MYRDLEKRKIYVKKYNTKHRKKYNKYNKDRYIKIKNFINSDKLTKGCQKCGYNKCAQALHYDHIDRTKKYRTIAHLKTSYDLETIKNEMSKCRVLCANCHSEKTFKNQEFKQVI